MTEDCAAFIFKNNGEIISQYDRISQNQEKNIAVKYPNIFMNNNMILNPQQQKIVKINDVEYIKYTTLLESSFGSSEYLSIISPLDVIMKPYKEKIYTTLQTTIALIIIFILPIVFYAVQLIVKPILELQKENSKIKNNDFESIKPINSFMLEISDLSKSMVTMADAIKDHQENLEEKIIQRTKEIENLLNNAGQGFLSFDKNMIIGSKYSLEARNIFEQEIASLNITHLLCKTSEEQLFLESTLQNILEEDAMKQEILLSLLQKEFFINEKFIEVEYKVLDKNNFMLILTNITDKKELAKKVQQEQQLLKMVVEIVTSYEQFKELQQDYVKFITIIQEYKSVEKLSNLRKLIHTYKGLFAQKEMFHIVEHLHNFETDIDQSLKDNKLLGSIQNITTETMNSWLEEDIAVLKEVLGKDFFDNQNTITIDITRIQVLQNALEKLLREQQFTLERNLFSDIKNIANGIEALSYHNIIVLLKPYEKLVEKLAFRFEKYINPLQLECDNIYLSNKYKPFLNSLVHIFRNSVDHGIEDLETRYEKEKEEFGTIICKVKELDKIVSIEIEDDGAGVDIQKIKQLALEKKLYTQEELNNYSEEQIVMILFDDGFSTSDVITDISGRGVGLASIFYEVNKLKGTIKIENNCGRGIKFIFNLPYERLRYG